MVIAFAAAFIFLKLYGQLVFGILAPNQVSSYAAILAIIVGVIFFIWRIFTYRSKPKPDWGPKWEFSNEVQKEKDTK